MSVEGNRIPLSGVSQIAEGLSSGELLLQQATEDIVTARNIVDAEQIGIAGWYGKIARTKIEVGLDATHEIERLNNALDLSRDPSRHNHTLDVLTRVWAKAGDPVRAWEYARRLTGMGFPIRSGVYLKLAVAEARTGVDYHPTLAKATKEAGKTYTMYPPEDPDEQPSFSEWNRTLSLIEMSKRAIAYNRKYAVGIDVRPWLSEAEELYGGLDLSSHQYAPMDVGFAAAYARTGEIDKALQSARRIEPRSDGQWGSDTDAYIEIVSQLMDQGQWDQGWQVAQSSGKFEAIALFLANWAKQNGRNKPAPEWFDQGLDEVARHTDTISIANLASRNGIWMHATLAAAGTLAGADGESAFALVQGSVNDLGDDPGDKAEAWRDIAKARVMSGLDGKTQFAQALAEAAKMADPLAEVSGMSSEALDQVEQEMMFEDIARDLSDSGYFDTARTVALGLTEPEERVSSLLYLAESEAKKAKT